LIDYARARKGRSIIRATLYNAGMATISFRPMLALVIAAAAAAATTTLIGCSRVFHPPSPTQKWEFETGKPDYRMKRFPQSPAIAEDGTIYVGARRGLYALNPNGTKKWFRQSPYESASNSVNFAVIDDAGNIWLDEISTLTGAAMRIGPDGEGRDDGASLAPVTQIGLAYDGTIFMATEQAIMLALEHSGKVAQVKWNRVGMFFALPPDNSIFTVSGNALTHYSADGTLVWIDTLPASCGPPALGRDSTIYLGCSGKILAFNSDSTSKWSLDLPGQSESPSVAQDGTLYLACQDRNVCAITPDGHLKWEFHTGNEVHSIPAIARNGNIYFGSSDNKLYAVGADGKERWEFPTQGDVYSPTIADDGSIYVQCDDGKIHAIQDLDTNGGLSGQWPKVGANPHNNARGGSSPLK